MGDAIFIHCLYTLGGRRKKHEEGASLNYKVGRLVGHFRTSVDFQSIVSLWYACISCLSINVSIFYWNALLHGLSDKWRKARCLPRCGLNLQNLTIETLAHPHSTRPLPHSMYVWESVLCCLGGDDIMNAHAAQSPATPHRGALKANPDPVDHQ